MENQDMFAKLDGFSVDVALSRLAGNRSLYKTLLTRFLGKYSGAAAELRASLAAGNLEEVQRNAHTIKGLAASMGHGALSEAAKDVEHAAAEAIRDSAQIAAISSALDSFAPVLDLVVSTLSAAFPESAASAPAAPAGQNVDKTALKADLGRLEILLEANDGEATAVFERLSPGLKGLDAGAHAMLRQAMQNFDFDQALRLAVMVRSRLS